MDPLTGSALLAAVPAVTKGVTGLIQMGKAGKLGRKRPIYRRPKEIIEATKSAKLRASGIRLPGQGKIEEGMEAGTSNLIRQAEKASDPGAFLQTLTTQVGKTQAEKTKLGIKAAQEYQARQKEKDAALKEAAKFTEKEFDINKMQPYKEAAAAKSALTEAGIKNIASGVTGVAGAASSMIGAGTKVGSPTPGTGGQDLSAILKILSGM